MRKSYWVGGSSLFLFLMLASFASADWEEFSKPLYLDVSGENYRGTDLLTVEDYFIKLVSLDYAQKTAGVVISDRLGVVYYEGLITPTEDFLQQGKIWVRWEALQLRDGHPQVRFKIFLWQQLSIVDFNIPRIMNWEDEYNVYMDWKNTGNAALDVFFQMVAQDGFVTPVKLDQTIHFDPWDSKRVYFRLRPEKYVTTGPLTATRQVLDDLSLQLLIYSAQSGNVLRRMDLGRYSLTSGPAAFIEELVTPLTQFTGKEYEVKLRVRNSGYPQRGSGDVVQDSFAIKLEAPGFKIKDSDKQYLRLEPLSTKELTFVVTPLSGGVRTITATVSVDRKVVTATAEKVTVKGAKTLLLGDTLGVPRDFTINNNYKISIKVYNKGDFTEEVVVRLSSPHFKVKAPEFVSKLDPKSEQLITFDAIPELEGSTKLLFEVITSSESLRTTQYFKGQGIAADEKEITVSVGNMQKEQVEEYIPDTKPSVAPPVILDESDPEVVEDTSSQVLPPTTEPLVKPSVQEVSEEKQPSFSLTNLLLLILGIVIVLVLVALIVKMSAKKGSHRKKKKKVEGDFELE
ncbi:MAG TPA: hypothetical protein VJG90_00750 [Candidatus Nanoarchaeia archaeon]|nr:hypothetical protein [Candidatus Nanoarchaeia archaeon]